MIHPHCDSSSYGVSRFSDSREKMPVSYTGNLNDSGDSFVILNFSEEGVKGLISTQNGKYIIGSFKILTAPEQKTFESYKETDLNAEDTRICDTDFPPSGNVSAEVSNSSGGYYVIQVLHRNAIETWSSAVVNFTSSGTAIYDFTTLQNRAYGSNQILTSGRWCLYSGDIDHNGLNDLDDILAVYNDAANFKSGYVATDLTGNETVDLNDILFTFNNSNNFSSKIIP